MKFALACVIGAAFLTAGCSNRAKPLASGNAVSGTIWEHPPSAVGSNSGSSIPQGAWVEVYERLMIVTGADGSRQVVPLEYVTDLKLK